MHSHVDRPRFGRCALAATACLLAIGLAACGGGSSKGSSSTAGGDTGASQGSGASSTTPSGGTDAKATCSQITKEQVQELIVDPITKVSTQPYGVDGKGQACYFATSDSDDALVISVLSGQEATDTYNSDVQSLAKAVSVSGVGDKAMRDAGDATPAVTSMKGDRYCNADTQSDLIPGVGALMDANGNTNNIGDQAYGEISAAIGTVCNRFYGSGNTTPDLSELKAAGAAAASQPTTTTALTVPVGGFTFPTDGSTTP